MSKNPEFVKFDKVDKSYDGKVLVVKDLQLDIAEGEFITMLGPSGSGKTTTLMMLAGFETPTNGEIFLDGMPISKIPPYEREIGMVFQNYALFPHMTVQENLAFPLEVRKMSKEETKSKVQKALDMVELGDFGTRFPAQLSGGQQQRVALARALVFEPRLVLMDEPLTVIDPDLKFRLRRNLKEINEQYKTTLVYVTHDQNEAMTFADNIIVMSEGEVVQTGSPKELFERPNTTFVGYFIGSPAMNLFESEASSNDSVKINNTLIKTHTNLSNLKTKKIKLGIRSEFIKIAQNQNENLVDVNVEKVEDLGNYKLITAKLGDFTIKSKVTRETEIPSSKVKLHIPADKCCVYEDNKLI